MDAKEQENMMSDILDVVVALLTKELAPVVERLNTLELEAELAKAQKPRVKMPAGSRRTP